MAAKNITDKQVVEAIARYNLDRARWPYEILSEVTGECEKVCFRAMERASNRGLLNYGVSLRTAWLTDKGRELLESR
jgi:hypothetical protein